MKNKSLWAGLAAITLVSGLQAQILFPEEVQTMSILVLAALAGICVYQISKIQANEKLNQKNQINEAVVELKKEVRNIKDSFESLSSENRNHIIEFAQSISEKLESLPVIADESRNVNDQLSVASKEIQTVVNDFRRSANDSWEENIRYLASLKRDIKDTLSVHFDKSSNLQKKLISDVRELSIGEFKEYQNQTEALLVQFQTETIQHHLSTKEIVTNILETIDYRNQAFMTSVEKALEISQQLNIKSIESVTTSINLFSEKVSEFKRSTTDALIEQNDLFSNNLENTEEILKNMTRRLNSSQETILMEYSQSIKDLSVMMKSLSDEYRDFKVMTQTMLDQMVHISEKDYSLLEGIFSDKK